MNAPNFPSSPEHRHARMERMIDRLPGRLARAVRWLRRPQARLPRLVAGCAFTLGGCLAILPLLGLWMLPIGLLLLSQDIPALERWCESVLDRIERRHPEWLYGKDQNPA